MRRVFALVLAVGAAGCGVSKQVVAEKEAALRECREGWDECAARTADCSERFLAAQADLDACRARVAADREVLVECRDALAAAASRVESLQGDLAECRASAAQAAEAVEALKAREDELAESLQAEIAAKVVEIERLKDRLAVRVVDHILFPSGGADILPRGKEVLDKVVSVVADTEEEIRVEGHTDDVPIGPSLKSVYFSNWELSCARAASVVRYFQHGHGVAPERMEAVGLSMYEPVVPNTSPENRQRNRRVEIVLTRVK